MTSCFGSIQGSVQVGYNYGVEKVQRCLTAVGDTSGHVVTSVASVGGRAARAVGGAFAGTFHKVVLFLKNNWQTLFAHLLAWGVIVCCLGLLYGFKAVALPFTIGISCGFVFGALAGIMLYKTPCGSDGKLTLWNFLNKIIEKLPPNGTRQIVLAVAVTVLVAASVFYPYLFGAVFGIILGNQLVTKIASNQNLGRDMVGDDSETERLKRDLAAVKPELTSTKQELDQTKRDLQQMQQRYGDIIQGLEQRLERLEKAAKQG